MKKTNTQVQQHSTKSGNTISANKESHIEQALTMYKENVSPSETYFQAILSQIPEQQKLKEGRAVRSPYRWLAITQIVTLAAVIIVVLPSYIVPSDDAKMRQNNPYYETDKQIEAFELLLDEEDSTHSLEGYSL